MANCVSESTTDKPLLALGIRLLGIAGFALMAALIKLASESGVHVLEIVFWRQAVSLPLLLGLAFLTGGFGQLGTQRPKAHAVRALYGIIGMILNFGAVILLPLAEATTIGFSAPIFAVILSAILLKESVGIWRWSAVFAGFAGIVIIAEPSGGAISLNGALVALGAAFMIALISIQIRDLGRTDKPVVIVFWFSLATVITILPAMLFVHEPLSSRQVLLLIGVGLTGTWGQFFITMALRFGKVSSVIVMDYSSLVWATLYGWLFFAVLPTANLWLGAPLIITAGVLIAWRENVLRKERFAAEHPVAGT